MNQLRTIGAAILKHHGFFSLDQIIEETKFSRKLVTDTLVILSQEGFIKKITKQRKEHIPGHSPRFSLTYRVGNRKAFVARIAPRLKKNTNQDRMWYVIRNKFRTDGSFNLHDLMLLAGVKKGTARWYIKALRRDGYITPSRKGGGPGVEWRMTGDFGPERPYIKYPLNERKRRQKIVPLRPKKGY
jgi:Mn-dependent DtxR family transcriptional regulator